MSSSVSPFNLKKQLAFYGAYHTNKVNVAIHVVCVPIIIWGTLLLLAGLGPLPSPPQLTALNSYFPDALTKHVELNWSAIFMSVYWLYYATLDTTAALMLSPIWYGLYYSAMAVYHNYEHGEAMKIATIVFTFGWISQFYGHGVHEGRAPALLDNLLGAVVLAPFFVFLEVAFHFGYRPELQKYLKNETGRLIADFRKKKADAKRGSAKKAQ